MSSELNDFRERMRVALEVLLKTEAEFTECFVGEVEEHLESHEASLDLTRALVKEIPDQPSLDHNGVKREIIKELEEMGQRTQALRKKVAKLRKAP